MAMMDRMRIARRGAAQIVALALASGFALGLGGCVSDQAHQGAMGSNRALSETNTRLQADLDQTRQELAIEKTQRQQVERANSLVLQENRALKGQLSTTNASFAQFEKDIAQIKLIDPTTNAALAKMARENEGFSYDYATGILSFSSDLTFASGSDTIKDTARSGLAALATVLNSSTAANYEIRIVGHTDSQPISSGTAKRFPTNMHLSCYRAISVRKELASLGVPMNRMMAAGWGSEKPLVPNNAKGGTKENRRVEIFLTPASNGNTMANVDDTNTNEPVRNIQPEINK
jgi:chemotaxis protein MotB